MVLTCCRFSLFDMFNIIKCFTGTHAECFLRRRIDDDMGRTHELEHSAIKCMRGIMYCYMRQSDKVGHSVTP